MATHLVFLPGESHGWRSLAGYSPWGHKESDTTEQLTIQSHFHLTQLTGLVCLLHMGFHGKAHRTFYTVPEPSQDCLIRCSAFYVAFNPGFQKDWAMAYSHPPPISSSGTFIQVPVILFPSASFFFFFLIFIYLVMLGLIEACGIKFPDQRLNLGPLHREHGS